MVFLILDRFLYKDSVCRQEVGGTTEDTHRYFSAPCCVLTKLERWLVMMSGEARCEAIISAIIKSSDLPSRSLHGAVWKNLMSFLRFYCLYLQILIKQDGSYFNYMLNVVLQSCAKKNRKIGLYGVKWP